VWDTISVDFRTPEQRMSKQPPLSEARAANDHLVATIAPLDDAAMSGAAIGDWNLKHLLAHVGAGRSGPEVFQSLCDAFKRFNVAAALPEDRLAEGPFAVRMLQAAASTTSASTRRGPCVSCRRRRVVLCS
jgi:hypothetical protein